MSKTATVRARIEPELKTRVENIFEKLKTSAREFEWAFRFLFFDQGLVLSRNGTRQNLNKFINIKVGTNSRKNFATFCWEVVPNVEMECLVGPQLTCFKNIP